MNEERGLLGAAWEAVRRNPRYILWFWLLNLVLAWAGTYALRGQMSAVLDNSLHADKLLHGFDATALIELLSLPQTGQMAAWTMPAYFLAGLFAVSTLLLMPGVLRQYTSEYRVSRDEFFRTCGRNLWRFIRLVLLYAVIAALVLGILFGIRYALVEMADKALSELLPVWVGGVCLVIIFVVATFLRIWFDLAEVDVVVRDQNAVRKSVAAGFRYTWRFAGQLLAAYVGISILALIVLLVGLWLWNVLVPPRSVFGAFVIGQIMMLLWLAARFWQRAVAAAFYMREMLVSPSFDGLRGPAVTAEAPVAAAPMPSPS